MTGLPGDLFRLRMHEALALHTSLMQLCELALV